MYSSKKADLAWLLLIFCLIAAVTIGCCVIFKEPLDKAFKTFNEAMIIQPDNTLVVGDLTAYSTEANGRMYKLSMSNGKTYLVPYSRIILIQTDQVKD